MANLTVLDQDISQNHICVLQDGSKWFETKMVSTSTAQVLVKTNADLDYEAMNDTTVTCKDFFLNAMQLTQNPCFLGLHNMVNSVNI